MKKEKRPKTHPLECGYPYNSDECSCKKKKGCGKYYVNEEGLECACGIDGLCKACSGDEK